MNILLHACCAPCLLYPADQLNREHINFTGYFYNPNIHPFREFKKRLDSVRSLAAEQGIKTIVDNDYGLQAFLRAVVFKEQRRCVFCYHHRLHRTANMAQDRGFDSFSSTLLYSKYQNHSLIVKQAQIVQELYDVSFFYRDFRHGWQQGIDGSAALDLYRQNYCGCIYSEQERYDNRLKKRLKKERRRHV